MTIRYATIQDMSAIQEIYSYYVNNSNVTFAYEVPSISELETQFLNISSRYPYLVYCESDKPIAYAYASTFKDKEAYQWSCELTIYVHNQHQKKHIGRKLLTMLLDDLTKQHMHKVYSCITIPNKASMALHQTFGFEQIALFPQVGFKHEQWLDVVWLSKTLSTQAQPLPFIPIHKVHK